MLLFEQEVRDEQPKRSDMSSERTPALVGRVLVLPDVRPSDVTVALRLKLSSFRSGSPPGYRLME